MQTRTQPQSASTQPPLTEGSQLQGTVSSNSRPSAPLIQTPVGTIALEAPLDLPPGTQVTLQVMTKPTPPPPSPDKPDPAQSKEWPKLQEGLTQLRAKSPELAETLTRHLPQLASPKLATQLFSLVRAAHLSGTKETLLSEFAKLTDKAHPLASLLSDEPVALQDKVRLPSSGQDEWKAFTLPLLVDDRWERLRLVVRDRPEGDGRDTPDKPEQGTRFLIDLEMTQLGPVQLDGLVKGRAKRFDLIIRTHAALPQSLQSGITEVFTRTLDGFGMSGKTSFVATRAFIEPFPNWSPPAGSIERA